MPGTPTRQPLSVAVITRNEAQNLDRCLRSIAWADEIVVVDSGSTDKTVEIARRHGAKVQVEAWRGFAAQKNLAISLTSNLWVLSLDADEWLGEDGAAEVRRVLESPTADAYAFDRLNAFSGSFVGRIWSPDWHVRLFRKDRGRFEGGHVHESFRVDDGARVVRLESRLYHLTYRTIREHLDRMNRYTDLNARTLRERGKRFSVAQLLLSPWLTFLKLYVFRGGFLDGMRGVVVAVGSAYSVFVKYAKLWELTRGRDLEFTRLVPATPEDPDPAVPPSPPSEGAHL